MFKSFHLSFYKSLFAIFIATFLSYSNSFHSEFIGDDIGQIVKNEASLAKGFVSSIQDIMPDRPLLSASLWLNYQMSGLNPISYKIVNLLFHFANGLLIYFLLIQLLSKNEKVLWISTMSALLFVCHPLNNQAINSIIQRGVLMAVFFGLLSFIFYIKYNLQQKQKLLWFSVFFFFLSIISKPILLVLPAIFILYSLIYFKKTLLKLSYETAPFFLVCAVPGLFYFLFNLSNQASAYTSWGYLRIQSEVLMMYFTRYFVPIHLSFNYPIEFLSQLTVFRDLQYLFLFIYSIVILLAFYFLIKTKKYPIFLFIAGFICLIPESTFFAIAHVAFDHRNYAALVFFISAFVICLSQFSVKLRPSLMALVLGYLTFNYNEKINTYQKWALYNIESNHEGTSFIDYNISLRFRQEKFKEAQEILALATKYHPKDNNYLAFEKLSYLLNTNEKWSKSLADLFFKVAMVKEIRPHFLSLFDLILLRKLPDVYNSRDLIEKLNAFYMNHFEMNKLISALDRDYQSRFLKNLEQILALNQINNSNDEKQYEQLSEIDFIHVVSAQAILSSHGRNSIEKHFLSSLVRKKINDPHQLESLIQFIENL